MNKSDCVDVKHKKRGRPRSTTYQKKQRFINELPLFFTDVNPQDHGEIPSAAE
jgi:hypothetical protein